jgi:lipopolysaccharide/colanic/teichoic acid biosynthesis glycosyltransferase
MSKQSFRISDSNPSQARSWESAPGVLVYAAASIALAALLWAYLGRFLLPGRLPGFGWLGVLVILPAFEIAAERTLAGLGVNHAWRYRLAFLGAAGLFFLSWGGYAFSGKSPASLGWLVFGIAAAFLAGLLSTTLAGSPWENNSPPPARVQASVLRQHLRTIGRPNRAAPAKRAFDLLLAALGLLLAAPIWLLAAFLIWFEDPGPLFFVKNSVGRGGVNFRQYKFRTMVRGAEDITGPVLAREGDERVLRTGQVLRKTAQDELPQLVNILIGEMSFVGPRPQRTVLVEGYLLAMPEYAERHRVLPGLAGLAQVAGDYYLTPRQKLRFDRLYIRYSGLGFDLKLIGLAFLIAFWFRWQPGWNGRLPRKYLHKRRPGQP